MAIEDMLYDVYGVNSKGSRRYTISFRPNGSSDPTVYFGLGVNTVAYVAGSIIKFTMMDGGWTRCLLFTSGVQAAAGGAGQGFNLDLDTTNTNLDTGVIAVAMVNNAGTRADIASDANTMCYFEIVLSKDPGDS